MKKHVGRVRRNESEEIRLSLQEVDGELHLELRVYVRSKRQGEGYVPEPEAVVVPTRALPDLCLALEEVRNSLHDQTEVESQSLPDFITIDTGSTLTMDLAEGFNAQPATAPDIRTAVNLPFVCYLLGAQETWAADVRREHVAGEVRILSRHDALVWLSEKFPPPTPLAVVIRTDELSFRGQAEVVEVASHPREGKYWHRLEWRSLTPQAKEALPKIIDAAALRA